MYLIIREQSYINMLSTPNIELSDDKKHFTAFNVYELEEQTQTQKLKHYKQKQYKTNNVLTISDEIEDIQEYLETYYIISNL